LKLTNKETGVDVKINSSDLSITSYSFANGDPETQWADVETPRYQAWSEKNIAHGIKKLWGFT
jgi:hypothetical protein